MGVKVVGQSFRIGIVYWWGGHCPIQGTCLLCRVLICLGSVGNPALCFVDHSTLRREKNFPIGGDSLPLVVYTAVYHVRVQYLVFHLRVRRCATRATLHGTVPARPDQDWGRRYHKIRKYYAIWIEISSILITLTTSIIIRAFGIICCLILRESLMAWSYFLRADWCWLYVLSCVLAQRACPTVGHESIVLECSICSQNASTNLWIMIFLRYCPCNHGLWDMPHVGHVDPWSLFLIWTGHTSREKEVKCSSALWRKSASLFGT